MRYERFIPADPVAKARPRFSNGHVWTPKKSAEYEETIREWTNDIRVSGPISMIIYFHMPMPESWSKKKKSEMCGKPHTGRPDLDNLIKAILDGMGNCWSDDSTVWTITATKRYADVPGIWLDIKEEQE